MAIGLAAVAAVGAIWGGVNSAKKARDGRLMQQKAQESIDNFKHQDLTNSYDELGVSRLGADLQRQGMAQGMATSVDALRSGGVRGVLGGLGKVHAQNQYTNQMIGSDLDRQQKELDRVRAAEDARIMNIKENRDNQKLAGYGQLLNTGMQLKYDGQAGVSNAVSSLGSIASSYGSGGFGSSNTSFGGWGGGAMGGQTSGGFTPQYTPYSHAQPKGMVTNFSAPFQAPIYTGG